MNSTEYNRIFEEKHELGGLLVFNFSESLNTIREVAIFASLPSEIWVYLEDFLIIMMLDILLNLTLVIMDLKNLLKIIRYGFFPSVGFGWIVSNEDWLEE